MAPRLTVRDIVWAERSVALQATQLFLHAGIEMEDGGASLGATAELVAPERLDTDRGPGSGGTMEQLRRALAVARELYLAHGRPDTAFGLHAACHAGVAARCRQEGIPVPAVAFAAAQIDKAILDALLRALERDLYAGMKENAAGLDARLTPDLDGTAIAHFLQSRAPLSRLLVRHTVATADPPESLECIHRETGCRYFKLKLSGDPAADRDRLTAIAQALAALRIDYRVTLDGDGRYPDHAALAALVHALLHEEELEQVAQRLLYIEQPHPRELTWTMPLAALGESFAFIIDGAGCEYDAFPRVVALGYRGISSKAGKGPYSSLLNGARAVQWSRSGSVRAFVTGEGLSCQPGLALQQDAALLAFHGVIHAGCDHHGVGSAAMPEAEARAFGLAHPDLYDGAGQGVRVAVRGGALDIASLAQPGFASGVGPRLIGPHFDPAAGGGAVES